MKKKITNYDAKAAQLAKAVDLQKNSSRIQITSAASQRTFDSLGKRTESINPKSIATVPEVRSA